MNIETILDSDDRAVSPVIGVILMVAITVILAAVIGTFVLGLGDQIGDSAPQASFSTSEVVEDTDDGVNFTIEKTGGQDLDTELLVLSVEGDRNESIGEGPWQTGQSIEFENEGPDDPPERVTIRLIHSPSGDPVYTTTATVRSS